VTDACPQHILLTAEAADAISREASASVDGKETGGILLGSMTTDDVVLVKHAGLPGPRAIRQPDFATPAVARRTSLAHR